MHLLFKVYGQTQIPKSMKKCNNEEDKENNNNFNMYSKLFYWEILNDYFQITRFRLFDERSHNFLRKLQSSDGCQFGYGNM